MTASKTSFREVREIRCGPPSPEDGGLERILPVAFSRHRRRTTSRAANVLARAREYRTMCARPLPDQFAAAHVFKLLEELIDGSIERCPVERESASRSDRRCSDGAIRPPAVRQIGGNISRRDQRAATRDRYAAMTGRGQRAPGRVR